MKWYRTKTTAYTLYGALFGLCFPIGATLLDILFIHHLDLSIASVRKGGSIGLVGNLAAKTDFALQAVVTRELTIYGSCACNGEYAEALERIADGSIKVAPLISAVAPLEEGANWFDRLYEGKEDLLKVILEPASA